MSGRGIKMPEAEAAIIATMSKPWQEAFNNYWSLTGFPPMLDGYVEEGLSLRQVWRRNIQFIEDLAADAMNIHIPWESETENASDA